MNYDFVYQPGNRNILIISFSSKGVEDSHRVLPEFRNTLLPLDCHLGFAMDIEKTWFNRADTFYGIKEEIDALHSRLSPIRTVFLGVSMGGFGAILFSKYCKCNSVVAFSPQIDLTVEWDNRYNHYYEKIVPFIFPTVASCFVDDVDYIVIACGTRVDSRHVSLIPEKPNIKTALVSGCGHSPLIIWKQKNTLHAKLKEILKI